MMTQIARPIVLFLALTLLAGGAVFAQDVGEQIDELGTRFWEQMGKRQYADAEKTAGRMIALGERNAEDGPNWITYGQLDLADLYRQQGRYAEAEELCVKAAKTRYESLDEGDWEIGWALSKLGMVYFAQGRFLEAEKSLSVAVEVMEAALDENDEDLLWVRTDLADVQSALGRTLDAEKTYLQAIKVYEENYGPDDVDLISLLNGLGAIYLEHDRYAEAEKAYSRALKIAETQYGKDHPDTAICLMNMGALRRAQGRYLEAVTLCERGMEIRKRALGENHIDVAYGREALATAYRMAGDYAAAEREAKAAEASMESLLGPVHPDVANCLSDLADVYSDQSRYVEAEVIKKRVRAILEKTVAPNSPSLAQTLSDLAAIHANQGRFSQAEVLLQQAEEMLREAYGPESYYVYDQIYIRAQIYAIQGRYDEAEKLYLESLAGFVKLLGEDSSIAHSTHRKLGEMYFEQKRYEEAERYIGRSLEGLEKELGREHPEFAYALLNMAAIRAAQDHYEEAEPMFDEALAIIERTVGPDNTDVADALLYKAEALHEQDRGPEAEPLLDRAIALYERAASAPGFRSEAYFLRARVAWDADRKSEALADLREAMDLAEQQRGTSSGAERERAGMFGEYSEIFEQMVAWQSELGDVVEALAAIERARARSLLDELTRTNVDLDVGRSNFEREQLRQREATLKERIASLEKQLATPANESDKAKQSSERRRQIETELAAARDELYRAYRDARGSNPVYRNLLAAGTGPPRLSQIRARLVDPDGLLLVYLTGKDGCYCISISPNDEKLVRLELDAAAAKALGTEAGPLTADRLQSVLMNDTHDGVLQQLSDKRRSQGIAPKLHTLYEVLIPEAARQALAGDSIARLMIVPDGPLALLPFEALVVEPGDKPRYLLDVGPPVVYGASASVLYNLKERRIAPPNNAEAPLLTVGDPAYPDLANAVASAGRGDEEIDTSTRYSALGGHLQRLPNSGLESRWLSDVFDAQGIKSEQLLSGAATEANVRREAAGRRWVHLACHGLVDTVHGNFFGALALTPGEAEATTAADNGFLTLPEISQLDLHSCELAILSACQTNYGPRQHGEGVWGLTRGFLVAGARRVVASNWLVDDEAAASLISYFGGGLAQATAKDDASGYASALQAAKRWVRQQPKWESPYYWATFVMVGPN